MTETRKQTPRPAAAATKEGRLAAALRANLARRKAQARRRAEQSSASPKAREG